MLKRVALLALMFWGGTAMLIPQQAHAQSYYYGGRSDERYYRDRDRRRDERREYKWRQHEWRENERRERAWREHQWRENEKWRNRWDRDRYYNYGYRY